MCTVTFVALARGYIVGMNRDEKLARARALPPAVATLGRDLAVFPKESSGGTWIGVNSWGTTVALINWYAVPCRVEQGAISRGEVVKSALAHCGAAASESFPPGLPLDRVNPFRLLVFAQAQARVVEWQWDLHRLHRVDHPWLTNTWISSGFDEPGAQISRGHTFATARPRFGSQPRVALRRLHRSHVPEPGPYSTCMHRNDAATVSYTEISVSKRLAKVYYAPGPPCSTEALPVTQLRLCPMIRANVASVAEAPLVRNRGERSLQDRLKGLCNTFVDKH